MLGQFGGLGELEKFITVTIGVYIAGRMVKAPSNRVMVGVAAITGTAAQLLMGTIVDIAKVQFAVEDFEAVEGLPESVFATEGFAFCNDLLFSGILFCLLPTLYLVPKLYGKIEPLVGMQPRTPDSAVSGISPKAIVVCVIGFVCAVVAELAATARHVPHRLGDRVGPERHRPGCRYAGGRRSGCGGPAGDEEERQGRCGGIR